MELTGNREIKTLMRMFWIAFILSSLTIRLLNFKMSLAAPWSFVFYYSIKILIYILVTNSIARYRQWARSTFNTLLFIEIVDTLLSITAILLTSNGGYTLAVLLLFDTIYAWVAFSLTFGWGAAYFEATRQSDGEAGLGRQGPGVIILKTAKRLARVILVMIGIASCLYFVFGGRYPSIWDIFWFRAEIYWRFPTGTPDSVVTAALQRDGYRRSELAERWRNAGSPKESHHVMSKPSGGYSPWEGFCGPPFWVVEWTTDQTGRIAALNSYHGPDFCM